VSTTARGTARTHFFPRRGYPELDGLGLLIRRNTRPEPPDDFDQPCAPRCVVDLVPLQILIDRVMHDVVQVAVGGARQPGQTLASPQSS
jgi:hypothetical protein